MKKNKLIFFIMLSIVAIVSIGIIMHRKALNEDNSNETSYSYEETESEDETSYVETFYSYEETELSNEPGEPSSENFMPIELK
ncbi:MAG: hypothetical protein K2J95_04720 [Lachnospiraceae bacterium]|nr:hypothetical protein [Lachnospiraceae bacterium]